MILIGSKYADGKKKYWLGEITLVGRNITEENIVRSIYV